MCLIYSTISKRVGGEKTRSLCISHNNIDRGVIFPVKMIKYYVFIYSTLHTVLHIYNIYKENEYKVWEV